MNSTVYRRSNSNWLSSHATDRSITYWRCQAREIFARLPHVEEVEVVTTGRKTDSELLGADKMPARNQYVIIASTGGKWGKSRRDYAPQS